MNGAVAALVDSEIVSLFPGALAEYVVPLPEGEDIAIVDPLATADTPMFAITLFTLLASWDAILAVVSPDCTV
jgi:hypothetical protein